MREYCIAFQCLNSSWIAKQRNLILKLSSSYMTESYPSFGWHTCYVLLLLDHNLSLNVNKYVTLITFNNLNNYSHSYTYGHVYLCFWNYGLMYPQASQKAVKLFLKPVAVKMVSKLKIFVLLLCWSSATSIPHSVVYKSLLTFWSLMHLSTETQSPMTPRT